MSDLLTTRQLQEMLKVDRTTIYRMVNDGRLPAIRVGNQWRFPRAAVEQWLKQQEVSHVETPPIPSSESAQDLFPLECVQQIQDAFADALGVMIVITDLDGRPITRVSNPCGLYQAVDSMPSAHRRCIELWVQMAQDPTLQPRFTPSHLGLLCARGLIRVGMDLKAMVILGGIAPDPWPPSMEEIAHMALHLEVPVETIAEHIDEVHRLSPEEQARVLPFAQRIADIMSHIATERHMLRSRLRRIAELTAI
ncbi:MAG TPA: helix-turn-helix domain-containing protein [Caldilineae bacterium]|nr:helix-turn-helix domain-containing protein [Caldilineae bacterium]